MLVFELQIKFNGYFIKILQFSIFKQIQLVMTMVIILYTLLVLAIISPWVFPNKLVSKHKKDLDV